MKNELDKQKDAEAWSTVCRQQAFKNMNKTKEELAWRHYVEKRLNFSEAQAMKMYEEDSAAELQMLKDKEYAQLQRAEDFKEEYTKKSYEIFFKVLVPATIGNNEPLKWTDYLTSASGIRSPTIAEIIKEQFTGIVEPLSVIDSKKFGTQISAKYDGEQCEYTFQTRRKQSQSYYRGNSTTEKVQFVLKASCFPVGKL